MKDVMMMQDNKEDKIEMLKKISERAKKDKTEPKKEDKDKEITELEQKVGEMTELLQRIQADFDNYRKRFEQEKSRLLVCASKDLVLKLLPVLDSFEIALKNNNIDKEKFVKGIEMIYAQFYSLLENEGLKPIEALGKEFDPYKHDVLMKQESDKDEDIVIDELQKGFTLNGEVIRHSKVKVSKKIVDKENKKECE